jgi:uncharacterized protein (TIGR00661 family)
LHILICPLDWGLGHASRCTPLISHLLKRGCKVSVAGSGRSLEFLKREFPGCSFVSLPSYRFFYGRKSMTAAMLISAPFILGGIFKEHQKLKKIITQNKVDAVISDNRFGLWNNSIYSVYLSHQVRIQTGSFFGIAQKILYMLHRFFMNRYHEIWIPDYEGSPNLSGNLSHQIKIKKPLFYLGPLSRFSKHYFNEDPTVHASQHTILFLISGPEPQRSIFEKMVLDQAQHSKKDIIILRGLPGSEPEITAHSENVRIYQHLDTPALERMIAEAELVIGRSGYSTIMDLAVMGKKAFFVPTPGQTEQEYLAAYLKEAGVSDYSAQSNFNLEQAIQKAAAFQGFGQQYAKGDFRRVVDIFIERLRNIKHG